MSRFENYTSTSENYDLTRRPAGIELILGALARGPRPLAGQIVLDAGCGTGRPVSELRAPRWDCHQHVLRFRDGHAWSWF